MPARRTEPRAWRHLRYRKDRRPRRLKQSDDGCGSCPHEPVAYKVLPVGIGKLRFYGRDLLDFRTSYHEPSRKPCRERADGQKDNCDPAARDESCACAKVFQHDHFKSETRIERSLQLYMGSCGRSFDGDSGGDAKREHP